MQRDRDEPEGEIRRHTGERRVWLERGVELEMEDEM
jgi:hypothetical protein